MADSRLFRIRRVVALPPDAHVDAVAAHSGERRQLLALAVSSANANAHDDTPGAHSLLVRSVEEDRRVRHWRFPLATSHNKQQQGRVEPIAALAFSPEGDWLACLSRRKNRLHLVPVATLISHQRRTQLERTYQPQHNREWMSVKPSVMTTPMASYLRATNEGGGLNGARYHSRVAGDDSQMSTLEFAIGMGTVSCCCWWRSMNGKNYCLVGGTENLVSIVNVEENAEECRCELQNAGAIESIELFYETFRKEKRTSMLVKTRIETPSGAAAGGASSESAIKYYRIVLEKRTMVKGKGKSTGETNASAVRQLQSTATEGAGSTSSSRYTSSRVSSESFVIKTFPEHFVEDMDFRPQRIKKNKPDVRLRAINGLLSSESGLAMLDTQNQLVSIYSNFQWSLKGQYAIPALVPEHAVDDVDIVYCSSDLMLLQGKNAGTGSSVSTWLSLPSRQGFVDDLPTDQAHIVHYLNLHFDEQVESVLQMRNTPRLEANPTHDSAESDPLSPGGEVIYVIQTAHNVYECHPQWSRVSLFRALRSQTIPLQDALSIGYALGIDMASLCEVVADTLCSEVLASDPADAKDAHDAQVRFQTLLWIRDIYDGSRVSPSKAVENLAECGAMDLAIDYAKRFLTGGTTQEPTDELSLAEGVDTREQRRVSLLVVDLIFQHQVQNSFDSEASTDLTLRPRDQLTQAALEDNEAWLTAFLKSRSKVPYQAEDMIDICLGHNHIDKAILVGIAHDRVPYTLQRLLAMNLSSSLIVPSGERALTMLLKGGFADDLLDPSLRVILRSLQTPRQVEVLLSSKSPSATILRHRDWVLRHVKTIPKVMCAEMASALAVRGENIGAAQVEELLLDLELNQLSGHRVESSEMTPHFAYEQVELFLTLLLRINDDLSESQGESDVTKQFSQTFLETSLREMTSNYRQPIILTRCVDFDNWKAAAVVHEAHGELVDAVECRLHSHQRRMQKAGLTSTKNEFRRDSRNSSIEEEDEDDENDCQGREGDRHEGSEARELLLSLRTELLSIVESLVLCVHQVKAHQPDTSQSARAAILARVIVKWFEYGLARSDLEVFLIDGETFSRVAGPLAHIFFDDVIEGVGGKSEPSNHVIFGERDKAWVRRCQLLPFSGQFLFHVCMWVLNHQSSEKAKPLVQSQPHLEHVVIDNLEKNDLSIRAIRIPPSSAQTVGKSDPLETHVRAFSCGHLFPKRIFEEEVLPEFEKRMNALPTPLFATKQLLLSEYRRSHVEAPCPVCSFNKISSTVFRERSAVSGSAQTQDHEVNIHIDGSLDDEGQLPHSSSYFFLHGEMQRSGTSDSNSRRYEAWEWRGTNHSINASSKLVISYHNRP